MESSSIWKTMTKQGSFQNHQDGWVSGSLFIQSIKTISTGLRPQHQSLPPWPLPALLPKDKDSSQPRRLVLSSSFLLDHTFGTRSPKVPAQMALSPFPGSTPASSLVPCSQGWISPQSGVRPKAWGMAKVRLLVGDGSVIRWSFGVRVGASTSVPMRLFMVWDGAGDRKRRTWWRGGRDLQLGPWHMLGHHLPSVRWGEEYQSKEGWRTLWI